MIHKKDNNNTPGTRKNSIYLEVIKARNKDEK